MFENIFHHKLYSTLILCSIITIGFTVYYFSLASKHKDDLDKTYYYKHLNSAVISLLFTVLSLSSVWLYKINRNINKSYDIRYTLVTNKQLEPAVIPNINNRIKIGVVMSLIILLSLVIKYYVDGGKSSKTELKYKNYLIASSLLTFGICVLIGYFIYKYSHKSLYVGDYEIMKRMIDEIYEKQDNEDMYEQQQDDEQLQKEQLIQRRDALRNTELQDTDVITRGIRGYLQYTDQSPTADFRK